MSLLRPRLLLSLTGLLVLGWVTPLRAQRRVSYFWEAGGSGGLTSINLDARPWAGLHLRAGGGLLLWPTLPMTATYVIGRGTSALEIGGGATVIFFPSDNSTGSLGDRFVRLVTLGQGLGTVVTATGGIHSLPAEWPSVAVGWNEYRWSLLVAAASGAGRLAEQPSRVEWDHEDQVTVARDLAYRRFVL